MSPFRKPFFSFVRGMGKFLTDVEQHVVDFVLKMRIEKNLTQADIGFILDVDNTFIYQIEKQTHKAKYNLNHVNTLADHWGISPKDFLPQRAYPVKKEEGK